MTSKKNKSSQLDSLIAPEIKNDDFYNLIQEIAATSNIKTILEIGSSSGGGSTEAFVKGIENNPYKPSLYCMEVSQTRFAQLQQTYSYADFVKCYNLSSVAVEKFPKKEEVVKFYNNNRTNLNSYPLAEVLKWLEQDIDYVINSSVSENGIRKIKEENGIDYFDIVLIDGSEFTGEAELDEVYGSSIILLDDINTFKNYNNYHKLLKDPSYKLIQHNISLGNSYAVFQQEKSAMLNLQELCTKHFVKSKGVIHIGAHEGTEIKRYQAMGVAKILFIEANPVVFERLSVNIANIKNVQAVNCAISNQNGIVNLHVTSMDQSSSILPLKLHQEIYPDIKETHQVTVKSRTLDTLLYEMEIQASDYNIINIDIQGAELLAFQGATDCLKYIDAINTEINYKELYEGCALISNLDDFLGLHGFERVATVTPFHPSWGDAFYVKRSIIPSMITMSTLGSNGRFGNQIFQYAFIKIYAKNHQLELQTQQWIGQYLFGHQEHTISHNLPKIQDPYNQFINLAKSLTDDSIESYANVDFWGYFQYHTSYYAPHKEYFCSLFQPILEVKINLHLAVQALRAKGKTLVGLHLRRGDYGYDEFFIAPNEWYKAWLREIWSSLEQPILFIASDEIDKVIDDFREYSPITSRDLGIEFSQADFYPDFYFLSQCDIVAISNSSFSFAACMLNEKGSLFVRPHLLQEKLVPFDPWNDYPILRGSQIAQKPLLEVNVSESVVSSQSIPIHFFTIVLNGKPFIRYHIDVFKKLPFEWHWHIVEGVADLKHDTAWSKKLGGYIADEIHHKGRSKDGTTEYLNELVRLYPENVTIYRQSEGVFWDGKREMVQASLANIKEECLLWQVDVDELWTVEQIWLARQLFVENPEKTAAYYWCWYFVGEKLVISTRNCYTQNPQQEWLRTWRFKPEYIWAAHEPPILVERISDNEIIDIAKINPFLHEETEKYNLLFQHYSYVLPNQLKFKETYYGYKEAENQWLKLQKAETFPLRLSEYLSWVTDGTMVNRAESLGIVPIAQKDDQTDNWEFLSSSDITEKSLSIKPQKDFRPIIAVDAVFFQKYKTGIGRVWTCLLEEWVANGFAQHIVVLDRAGTAPKIDGIWHRTVDRYDYAATDADRQMLQQVCDEEGVELFISTYYTTPISTPSVFMAYDMIPEVFGVNFDKPEWREKHIGIHHASSYITISNNTAKDLVKYFPAISPDSVKVAHCGIKNTFAPASLEQISSFKTKYGITKSYFILVGFVTGYKNLDLFLQAFALLPTKQSFEIVITGEGTSLKSEWRSYTSGSVVHLLQLSDEDLITAYTGAIALVYPSKYEGFGLPVLEALACGCPVITCPNSSIPEVAGEAAIYVQDNDINGLANALCEIQKPEVRQALIKAGIEQAKKFSWSKMAEEVSSALIEATLLPLNLRDINLIIFPDWAADEELLGLELAQLIKAIITHPNRRNINLLIHINDILEANFLLSSVATYLLIEEELDIPEDVEISPVGQLEKIQWKALLPRLQGRIVLENENELVIALVASSIQSYTTLDLVNEFQ